MNEEDGHLSPVLLLDASEGLEELVDIDLDLEPLQSDDRDQALFDDWDNFTPHNMDCKQASENLVKRILGTKRLGSWNYEQRICAGADFTTSTTESEVKDWGPKTYLTPKKVLTHVLPRYMKSDSYIIENIGYRPGSFLPISRNHLIEQPRQVNLAYDQRQE